MLEAAGTRMSSGYGATCLTAAETGFASRNVLRVQARAVRAPDGGGGGHLKKIGIVFILRIGCCRQRDVTEKVDGAYICWSRFGRRENPSCSTSYIQGT